LPVPSERILPLVVATALFMETMDSTILATALPTIARDLGVDPIALKLAITSYLVGFAVVVPVSGWLADRFGARAVFRSALGLFMLASIGCALSASLNGFVIWRFVQGAGGALMTPVGRLVLVRAIPKDKLVAALATLTIPALIGPITGPPLGGFIVTYFDWRWIFLVNLPMCLIGIALATVYFPNERRETAPLDVWGGFLVASGLTGLIAGAASTGRHVAPLPLSIAALVAGAISIWAYVRHARRHPQPLLDLRLFEIPTFDAGVAGGAVFRLGVGASTFLVPLMLQIGFGLDALTSGLITFTSALGALTMKFFAPRILAAGSFRRVLIFNGIAASALIAAVACVGPSTPHAVISGLLLIAGLSRSLQFTSLHAITYADVSGHQASAATSIASVAQQVSLSFGVALGALALETSQGFNAHTSPMAGDFSIALFTIAALSSLCAWRMARLPADAGRALSQKAAMPIATDDEGQ
jgi:EmrB/QacA subfamily drug resistance transporter